MDDIDEEFRTTRVEKKKKIPKLLSEDKVETFEEGDIRELVRNLWAFRGWTNKDYIVDQIIEGDIDHVRDTFQRAFYETEDLAEKFDLVKENVNMLGPASITEIFTFLYPNRCAIFNRRAQEALTLLGYNVPDRLNHGNEYTDYMTVVSDLMNSLEPIDTGNEIHDYVDLDFFLYYLSRLETDIVETVTAEPESVEDFDHDEIQQKLIAIGDGLGFDVEDEYEAGPGARLDVRWSTRVANLGVISYAFEVHRRGSRDSALLNLMKAQNADPSLQKLVIVSTEDQIESFRQESDAISADLSRSITYFEVSQVNKAETLLDNLKEVLQEAGLMGEL